jgi:hypothetical protein
MKHQQQVIVPPEWMERSLRWAERSVLGYENGEKEKSRAYARPGIDKSIDKQLMGKAGECAFCGYLRLDPELLDWGPKCDDGWDIEYCNQLIDVKASGTEYLMWPITKNEILARTRATVFASMHRLDRKRPDLFDIGGWCSKSHFIQHHHVAPPPTFLDRGTKHLHPDEIWPMDQLRDSQLVRSLLLRRQCDVLPALFSPIQSPISSLLNRRTHAPHPAATPSLRNVRDRLRRTRAQPHHHARLL